MSASSGILIACHVLAWEGPVLPGVSADDLEQALEQCVTFVGLCVTAQSPSERVNAGRCVDKLIVEFHTATLMHHLKILNLCC